MTDLQPIISANNLVKYYGQKKVIKGISLQVNQGECLALLGPNGAGKTTICELLEGLQSPDDGSLTIKGLSYKNNRRELYETIGVHLQETNLYKRYTVKETLALFASFYRNSFAVDDLIKRLDLVAEANCQVGVLSGGKRQRLYLGCAIINQPQVLFLDEPTLGLDPLARQTVWEVIKEFKKQQCAILLTTHYMEEAQRLADKVAIIDHGKIIAQGPIDELIHAHCKQSVVNFSIVPTPTATVTKLRKLVPTLESAVVDNCSWQVASDCPNHLITQLVTVCAQLDVSIKTLDVAKSSLEYVFLKLTGRALNAQ